MLILIGGVPTQLPRIFTKSIKCIKLIQIISTLNVPHWLIVKVVQEHKQCKQ